MTVKFVKKGLDQNLAWQITSIQFMKERNFHSSAKIVVLLVASGFSGLKTKYDFFSLNCFRNFLSRIELKLHLHHFRYFSGSTNHVSFILFTFFLKRVFFLRSFSNSVARADFSLLKIKGPFHDPMEHTEKSSVHGFSESVKRCFATRKRR